MANIPVQNGLYVCMLPPIIYAIVGGSAQMSVGPESVSAMLLGSFTLQIVSQLNEEITQEHMAVAGFVLLVMEGIILVLLGVFRQGYLDCVLIRGVMTGLIMAVGIGIMVSQTPTMLGIPNCNPVVQECPQDSPFAKALYTYEHSDQLSITTLLLSVTSMSTLFLLHALQQFIQSHSLMLSLLLPPNFLLVSLSLMVSYYFDLESYGIHILGTIQINFGLPQIPFVGMDAVLSIIQAGLMPAAIMAIILFTQ